MGATLGRGGRHGNAFIGRRGITIKSAVVSFVVEGVTLNLIDRSCAGACRA